MKNLLTALLLTFSLGIAAQATPAAKRQVQKTEKKTKVAAAKTTTVKLKKDGTPDKRYKAAKMLKKDGTPDKRYKANK